MGSAIGVVERAARVAGGGALALALTVSLASCGSLGAGGQASTPATQSETADAASTRTAPDLTGVWDVTGEETFSQQAVISGSTIVIYWLPRDGSERMLYWAGTFDPPSTPGSYTWTSTNDRARTGSELLASTDEAKEFTYDGGAISYSVSALGETSTVALEQTSSTVPAGADASSPTPEVAGTAEVVESGFAQRGDFLWASAMVQYQGLTGEFATVLFNVYDSDGTILASEEQIEQLTTTGTTFPIGRQIKIPEGATAASITASVSASDYGSSVSPAPVLEPISAPATELRFLIQNPTGEDWANPRIAIVCRDSAGKISGGGYDFPNLIPAGGEFLVWDPHLMVTDDSETCQAYVQLGSGS